MLVGVKFCGGCNPRYDRGKTLQNLKKELEGEAEFVTAEEGVLYDHLLIIGGCTNCCASYSQYQSKNDPIRIWDQEHIEKVINNIKKQEE